MPFASNSDDRQCDIEHQNELLLGKTRDQLTERELNEMVHWDAGCEWYIENIVGSTSFFNSIFFVGQSIE